MKRNSQHRRISATGNCPCTLFVKLDCLTNIVNLDSFGNTFFRKLYIFANLFRELRENKTQRSSVNCSCAEKICSRRCK